MPFGPQDKRERRYLLRRSITDYGMGTIIFCFGIFLIIAPGLGFVFTIEPLFRYCLSGLFIIYGAWRFYRGYQKKYFSEE